MANKSKYVPKRVHTLLEALREGYGRAKAVQMAGVQYHTFLKWLADEPGFADLVTQAESCGMDRIKELCKRRIIEDTHWTSAAWWLERNYPEEYRQRTDINSNTQIRIVDESE